MSDFCFQAINKHKKKWIKGKKLSARASDERAKDSWICNHSHQSMRSNYIEKANEWTSDGGKQGRILIFDNHHKQALTKQATPSKIKRAKASFSVLHVQKLFSIITSHFMLFQILLEGLWSGWRVANVDVNVLVGGWKANKQPWTFELFETFQNASHLASSTSSALYRSTRKMNESRLLLHRLRYLRYH